MDARALLASPLGLLIGLSLGAVGGGGSMLAIPALVYAAGQTPAHASATSLLLVAIAASAGLVPHMRAGRVRLGVGLGFGGSGIGGAIVGAAAGGRVDADVLMLAFSGVMVAAGVVMWMRSRPCPDCEARVTGALRADARTVLKVLAAGTVVGLMTGFFGVGGGFVIVPMLVLALGFSMPDAAGTSLVVIIVNSLVSLATRLQSGAIEWGVTVPFVVASLIGVAIGGRFAGRGDPRLLQRSFVGLLAASAVFTATKSALAVW